MLISRDRESSSRRQPGKVGSMNFKNLFLKTAFGFSLVFCATFFTQKSSYINKKY